MVVVDIVLATFVVMVALASREERTKARWGVGWVLFLPWALWTAGAVFDNSYEFLAPDLLTSGRHAELGIVLQSLVLYIGALATIAPFGRESVWLFDRICWVSRQAVPLKYERWTYVLTGPLIALLGLGRLLDLLGLGSG